MRNCSAGVYFWNLDFFFLLNASDAVRAKMEHLCIENGIDFVSISLWTMALLCVCVCSKMNAFLSGQTETAVVHRK